MRRAPLTAVAGVALAGFILAGASPALAHESREVEGHAVVVGWLEEPAFAGFPNGVHVEVSHDDGPLTGADLEVEVLYGGKSASTRTEPLPLKPEKGEPGGYLAEVVPTAPGEYTFHISGELEAGEVFDEYFMSGPDTFDRVERTPDGGAPPSPGPRAVVIPPLADAAPETIEPPTDAPSPTAVAPTAADTGGSNTLVVLGVAAAVLAAIGVGLAASRKKSK